MFEKEAEEYVNREYDNSYYPDCNFSAKQDAKTAFKDGAEFAYNQNMVFDKIERIDRAKKIIGNLYAICKDNHYPNSSVLMEQAEQFLKEVEND